MREPSLPNVPPAQNGPPQADDGISGSGLLVEGRFRCSSIAFYLQTVVRLTEDGLQVSRPRRILGLIPLGRSRFELPIDYTERVAVATSVGIGRLILGFLLASIGLIAALTGSVIVELGAVAIVLGAFSVLRSPTQAIIVKQAVGGSKSFDVSIAERHRIAQFAEEASEALAELHKRRGPVDLSEPRRRWRRRVLARRLAALGLVVIIVGVAAGSYRIYQDSDAGLWLDQQIMQQASKDGHWDLAAPSGRPIDTMDPSAKATPLAAAGLPSLRQIQFPKWGYQQVVGIDAISGVGGPKTFRMGISGYLVAKEKQGDASYLFGVLVPLLDGGLIAVTSGSTTPSCRSTTTTVRAATPWQSTETTVGGVIVWLRIFPATDTSWFPLVTDIEYGEGAFSDRAQLPATGMGPDVLYEYAKVGDPIRAKVDLTWNASSTDATKALDQFVHYRYASGAADARNKIEAAFAANMMSLSRLTADCATAVPLVDQLQGKRYVLSPSEVVFLPETTT